jgi:hypothetical protein
MKKTLKIIFFILSIGLFIYSLLFVVEKAKMLKLEGNKAAVSSTAASLIDSLYQNQVQIKDLLGSPNTNWQLLSDDKYDHVITKLNEIKSQSFDTRNWKPGLVLVDYWNQRLKIAFRKGTGENIYEFIVWSSGPDGINGTEDDISYPWKSKIPVFEKDSK